MPIPLPLDSGLPKIHLYTTVKKYYIDLHGSRCVWVIKIQQFIKQYRLTDVITSPPLTAILLVNIFLIAPFIFWALLWQHALSWSFVGQVPRTQSSTGNTKYNTCTIAIVQHVQQGQSIILYTTSQPPSTWLSWLLNALSHFTAAIFMWGFLHQCLPLRLQWHSLHVLSLTFSMNCGFISFNKGYIMVHHKPKAIVCNIGLLCIMRDR